jgi:hypothetical protein
MSTDLRALARHGALHGVEVGTVPDASRVFANDRHGVALHCQRGVAGVFRRWFNR